MTRVNALFGVKHEAPFRYHREEYQRSAKWQAIPKKPQQIDKKLWLPLMSVRPNWQRGNQGLGSCVAWGAELVATQLMAIQHVAGISEFTSEASTEAIYGGCRVEAQGGQIDPGGDGSWGSAAAEWLEKWGVLLREDYSKSTGIASHDLRIYSAEKEKAWGKYGCGGKEDGGRGNGMLDVYAKKHPIAEVVQIQTIDELAAALENDCTVTVASTVGYGQMERNREGIVRRSGTWAHQMEFGGIRWVNGEPQFRLFQSWGPESCSGPDPGIGDKHPAISGCSWWVVAEDAYVMLRANDTFAFSGIRGFEPTQIDYEKLEAEQGIAAVPFVHFNPGGMVA